MPTLAATSRWRGFAPLAPLALPVACLLWSFWPAFVELWSVWNNNPQYNHGYLVPLFAGFLLYLRRDKLDASALAPSLWGLPVLALALGMRLFGAYRHYISMETMAIVPCVAGLVLLVGGRAALRWSWPAVLFLVFMIPLPYSMSVWLSGPLQRLATISSTFVMQTLGMPALADGNIILLNDHQIGIVEACSGLRMLVVFFALSTAMILVVERHWIDKAIILASAVPIALLSNLVRVTTTGIMYEAGHSEMANAFFHDVAGWFMMPLALGMLWVELKVMSRLFIDTPKTAAAARPAPAPSARRITNPAGPRAAAAPRNAIARTRRTAQVPDENVTSADPLQTVTADQSVTTEG